MGGWFRGVGGQVRRPHGHCDMLAQPIGQPGGVLFRPTVDPRPTSSVVKCAFFWRKKRFAPWSPDVSE
jgi:hypothetical protein